MQPVQDLTVEDRVSRTQFQYSLESPDPHELGVWVPRLMEKLQALPESARRRQRPTERGAGSAPGDRPQRRRALGISAQTLDDTLYDAFGQRQVSTIFTQLNQYRVVLEVAPDFQQGPRRLGLIFRAIEQRRLGAAQRFHAIERAMRR